LRNKLLPVFWLLLGLMFPSPLQAGNFGLERDYIDHVVLRNAYNGFARERLAQGFIDLLELKKGESVADVGTAAGDFCWYFLKVVGPRGKVYGTDINPYSMWYLRQRAAYRGVKNLFAVVNYETRIPLPDKSLDAVLLCEVHVIGSRDPYHREKYEQPFVRELYRILKPGGRFLLVDSSFLNRHFNPINYPPEALSLCRKTGFVLKRKILAGKDQRFENKQADYFLFVKP